jgi:CRP-like cAMP-binding protein
MAQEVPRHRENRLLGTLDRATFEGLEPFLEPVNLEFKETLYEAGKPMDHVYFPVNGVLSMLARVDERALVEVATVGNEGMIGLPLFLGAELSPGTVISQVAGESLRMAADVFQRATSTAGPLMTVLHHYTQALMVQISQGNACNRLHSIEERCARWLLLTHDRVDSDEFTLTQEFLGDMLGVRRASVNIVAAIFQKAGFIRYSRGRITVLNRVGLESAACECYSVIREEYERLLGNPFQKRPK